MLPGWPTSNRGKRHQERQDALGARLFGAGRRIGPDDLRLAARRVVLGEHRVLERHRCVVVERGAVDLRAVDHRALLHVADDRLVAAPAHHRRHAQVRRIHEADPLVTFAVQQRVSSRADWPRSSTPREKPAAGAPRPWSSRCHCRRGNPRTSATAPPGADPRALTWHVMQPLRSAPDRDAARRTRLRACRPRRPSQAAVSSREEQEKYP